MHVLNVLLESEYADRSFFVSSNQIVDLCADGTTDTVLLACFYANNFILPQCYLLALSYGTVKTHL